MKYELYFAGRSNRIYRTGSMRMALAIAKDVLGAERVYRGAQYGTDQPGDDGERINVNALDIWTSRTNASREMDTTADCVISWR